MIPCQRPWHARCKYLSSMSAGNAAGRRTQRRSPRHAGSFEAHLRCRERTYEVSIVDISRHGARVRAGVACAVGARVSLEVNAPHCTFSVPSRVVWNDRARRPSMGLEFLLESDEDRRMLDGGLATLYGNKASKGDVLVMMESATASRALESAVREAGFEPIAQPTTSALVKHLYRTPGTGLVAALVGDDLASAVRQDALAYLTDEWPAVRRIAVPAGSIDVARALRGAGRYG